MVIIYYSIIITLDIVFYQLSLIKQKSPALTKLIIYTRKNQRSNNGLNNYIIMLLKSHIIFVLLYYYIYFYHLML